VRRSIDGLTRRAQEHCHGATTPPVSAVVTDISASLAFSYVQNVVVIMPANRLAYGNTFLMKNDLTIKKDYQQALDFGPDLPYFLRTYRGWAFKVRSLFCFWLVTQISYPEFPKQFTGFVSKSNANTLLLQESHYKIAEVT
jgi:hypothetical protein